MDSILEKIEQAIKDLLIGWIESNLTNMFTDVNDKVGTIASEVGRTPSAWNSGIYSMIRGLSENVIVPIAGTMSECTGTVPEPETPVEGDETEQPDDTEEPEKSSNMGMIIGIIAVVGIGGAAYYYFKFIRGKKQKDEDLDFFDDEAYLIACVFSFEGAEEVFRKKPSHPTFGNFF